MARTDGDYKERATRRASLRSGRNGKRPGGKPEGFCTVPGCTEYGSPCWYPDWSYGGPDGGPRKGPDEYLCDKHLRHSGFCKGCGNFWGGVESFEFGRHAGFCDDCASEIDAEEERERWWDDEYYDWQEPHVYDDEPGPVVIVGGLPEEMFS